MDVACGRCHGRRWAADARNGPPAIGGPFPVATTRSQNDCLAALRRGHDVAPGEDGEAADAEDCNEERRLAGCRKLHGGVGNLGSRGWRVAALRSLAANRLRGHVDLEGGVTGE